MVKIHINTSIILEFRTSVFSFNKAINIFDTLHIKLKEFLSCINKFISSHQNLWIRSEIAYVYASQTSAVVKKLISWTQYLTCSILSSAPLNRNMTLCLRGVFDRERISRTSNITAQFNPSSLPPAREPENNIQFISTLTHFLVWMCLITCRLYCFFFFNLHIRSGKGYQGISLMVTKSLNVCLLICLDLLVQG